MKSSSNGFLGILSRVQSGLGRLQPISPGFVRVSTNLLRRLSLNVAYSDEIDLLMRDRGDHADLEPLYLFVVRKAASMYSARLVTDLSEACGYRVVSLEDYIRTRACQERPDVLA